MLLLLLRVGYQPDADFSESFDVGVSLHACGGATDTAMLHCVHNRAAIVMCPCCVGKLKHSTFTYPRSKILRNIVPTHRFLDVAKAADYNKHVLLLNLLLFVPCCLATHTCCYLATHTCTHAVVLPRNIRTHRVLNGGHCLLWCCWWHSDGARTVRPRQHSLTWKQDDECASHLWSATVACLWRRCVQHWY